MLRKILSLLALSLTVLALAPSAVSATGYQVDNVDDTNVTPGQGVTVNFNGFKPGSDVTLTFNSDPVLLGVFPANAQGVVRVQVTIPANASFGNHTIVATGIDRQGNPKTSSLSIVVSATGTGGGSPGPGLPGTGADIALLVSISGLAIAGGWALLGAARRRQAA